VQNEELEHLRRKLLESASDRIRTFLPALLAAIQSYDSAWKDEFGREHDHLRLLGQDNFRRYLPFHEIRVRICPADTLFDIVARVAAARVTGARALVSYPPGQARSELTFLEQLTEMWGAGIEFLEETDAELAEIVRALPPLTTERVRYARPDRVPDSMRAAAAESGIYLADEPVLAEGRIELLWYVREQSISFDYHRYGNLGARAEELRLGPL
jgi:RHH-type proline utilization regulon transcriptional repressor/proline dehydrogenase/delta 1-pyrroline-5-carboxylate dehydrogenase